MNASDKNSGGAATQAEPQIATQADHQASVSSVAPSSHAEEGKTGERREFYQVTNDLPVIEPAIAELRRLRLRVALKIMLAFAAMCGVYVFASSFMTSSPNERSYETRSIPLEGQEPGTAEWYNWNGRPILVLHRSAEQLAALSLHESELQDPGSVRSRQPDFAKNRYRSSDDNWFVAIAAGTDFSCAIEYLAPTTENFRDLPWSGGFVDACRGARYDVAGRVYSGQHAKKNLSIPSYRIEGTQLILGAQ